MKLGAEPKKIAALCGLLVVAGIVYYMNSSDSPAPSYTPAQVAAVAPAGGPANQGAAGGPAPERHRSANRNLVREFKPKQGFTDPKDRPDPAGIDPTIRWDLLAKLQSIEPVSAGRNLFQFGSAPPPTAAALAKLPSVKPIAVTTPPPQPARPAGPVTPPTPTAPPMTFKYYGYKVSKSDGHKAAFLLDGDDILIAGENDTVKRHYRVVRIATTSITIEDTDFKSTQTLPLQENLAG